MGIDGGGALAKRLPSVRMRRPRAPYIKPAAPAPYQDRVWHFSWDQLPPSINSLTRVNPATGQRFTREGPKAVLTIMRAQVDKLGFVPDLARTYGVTVAFTVPSWAHDIDNRWKALGDLIFGSRKDHRIVDLHITKAVVPGVEQCECWVEALS